MMCSLSMSVSANSVIDYVEPGIELMYLYTDNVSTSVYRSGSNIAYKCDAKGKSTATKISIYLYLQEYSNDDCQYIPSLLPRTLHVSDK